MKESNSSSMSRIFLYGIMALFLAGSIINCGGGGSSSGPAQAKAQTALIQDYVAKHGTMVDTSLADFYVTDEQPSISAAIQKTIAEYVAGGGLEKLQNATFDFSNLQITVVGEKEDYVEDSPTKIFKVIVSGSYIIKQENNTETIQADETIIFAAVDNTWKVTEKINPWS